MRGAHISCSYSGRRMALRRLSAWAGRHGYAGKDDLIWGRLLMEANHGEGRIQWLVWLSDQFHRTFMHVQTTG